MRSLLYIIAVILIIGWALGVFVYSATGLIHALLVIAIIALLLGFIRRGTTAY
ncbi:lmo0937 family membrane protein [Mucilaginibacter sp. RS28]|uniref:Lmo0937 family membrane protein n=1 Tax=Mucilaginibacter straminoryzae TaxID=2932774 RepID=A0A9X2B7D5_9SPHI|nr:lmo0937 family membrane protein [Mucilaginibacter straminoryzae]MCJ8208201.1 lmo0937 family membrane protein [Mucilaginibacter straminoryzae]